LAGKVDFRRVADAALGAAERLVPQWLPQGRREGHEWKALNPKRADSRLGSFSVNLNSGAWADFATGDKGGDLISLLAYLDDLTQLDAARVLAQELAVPLDETPVAGPRTREAAQRVDADRAGTGRCAATAGRAREAWSPRGQLGLSQRRWRAARRDLSFPHFRWRQGSAALRVRDARGEWCARVALARLSHAAAAVRPARARPATGGAGGGREVRRRATRSAGC
jgi:hypothetical protein